MKYEQITVFLLAVIIVLLTILVTFSFRTAGSNEAIYSLLNEPFYGNDEGAGAGQASP